MHSPDESSLLCASCEQKPAVKRYARGGFDEVLCATCFDRSTVQELLENKLTHLLDLESRQQYDEALVCLDEVLETNRYRDHDGWLVNSFALHRTSILFDAGRYAEAEQAFEDWARVGFIDLWRRQMHALGLAKTLEALGRDREAIPVLENVLGHEDEEDLSSALLVLTELVRISEKLAVPVDSKWLGVAEAVAKYHGVEMPTDRSPAKAILALEEVLRSRQQGASEGAEP